MSRFDTVRFHDHLLVTARRLRNHPRLLSQDGCRIRRGPLGGHSTAITLSTFRVQELNSGFKKAIPIHRANFSHEAQLAEFLEVPVVEPPPV